MDIAFDHLQNTKDAWWYLQGETSQPYMKKVGYASKNSCMQPTHM